MTCPQITQSIEIQENAMRIMVGVYLGIYLHGQTKPCIVSLKGLSMIGKQEEKYQQDKSFRMLLRSTIKWYQHNNGLR